MNNLINLYKKELKSYLYSPATFVFIGLFGLVNNWLFFQSFFLNQQATLSQFFDNLPFLFLFLIPALSMGILSEEKKKGTWEILLSLPIKEEEIILGKFLAGLTIILLALMTTLGLPLTVIFLGNPDVGIIISGYLGAFLLILSFLALGIYISGLTSQQMASFLISFIILFINNIFGQDLFLLRLPSSLRNFFTFLSLQIHYEKFVSGLISANHLVFLISWTIIFLTLTYIRLKSSKNKI